jgi:mannosyltransferase OCH1-like enzyme
MIPKVIHQIWIGNKPIPIEFENFMWMWRRMYPDFTHILWDNARTESSDVISSEIRPFFEDNTFPFAFKADLLRYEIIKKYGGVYIDLDTEPLRRMPDSIFYDLSLFSGIQPNGEITIGIFGSEQNNSLISDVLFEIPNRIPRMLSNGISKKCVSDLTGPVLFTEIAKPYEGVKGYKFFEPKYFYPYWYLETERRYENFKETAPEAYSVHHWAHSWK